MFRHERCKFYLNYVLVFKKIKTVTVSLGESLKVNVISGVKQKMFVSVVNNTMFFLRKR